MPRLEQVPGRHAGRGRPVRRPLPQRRAVHVRGVRGQFHRAVRVSVTSARLILPLIKYRHLRLTPLTDIGPDRARLDGRSGPAFSCFVRFTYNALSPAAPPAASSLPSTASVCAAASPPTIRSIAIRTAIGKGASTRFPACTTSLSSVSPARDPALCASLGCLLAGWLAGRTCASRDAF